MSWFGTLFRVSGWRLGVCGQGAPRIPGARGKRVRLRVGH